MAIIKNLVAGIAFLAVAAKAHQHQHFDNGNFMVDIHPNSKAIQFDIEVNSTGWVGIGVNNNGSNMVNADMFIGGVYVNGTTFGADYHGNRTSPNNTRPVVDPEDQQHWIVLSGEEKNGKTFLSVTRLLKTGDTEYDTEIKDEIISLIWAYNKDGNDNVTFHQGSRGSTKINLLTGGAPTVSVGVSLLLAGLVVSMTRN